jgi:hypothetical protein
MDIHTERHNLKGCRNISSKLIIEIATLAFINQSFRMMAPFLNKLYLLNSHSKFLIIPDYMTESNNLKNPK